MKNKKKIIIGILLLVIVVIGGIFAMGLLKPKKEINSIKSLEYRESDGRSIYGALEFKYKCNGEECTLKTKPEGVPEEDAFLVNVTEEEQQELLELVQKYNVASWDGFNKSDQFVLDGSNFTFSVTTKDNVKIYASGYMKYPRNFSNFMKELEALFAKMNRKNQFLLFEHEYYKDFDLEKVTKLMIKKATVGGMDTEEVTDKEEIKKTYEHWTHMVVGPKCSRACEDNTTIYTFVMEDGKEYTIERECDWVIINNERYYYQYRKDV